MNSVFIYMIMPNGKCGQTSIILPKDDPNDSILKACEQLMKHTHKFTNTISDYPTVFVVFDEIPTDDESKMKLKYRSTLTIDFIK